MTVAAVAIVGVALVGGGIALVIVLRDTLTDQVRSSARFRADDLAQALVSGTSPAQVTNEQDDDLLVQVLDEHGDVIAASPDARRDRAMARLRPGASTEIGVFDTKDNETDKFLAVASTVDTAEGARTVVTARARSRHRFDAPRTQLAAHRSAPAPPPRRGDDVEARRPRARARRRDARARSTRSRRPRSIAGCPNRRAGTRSRGSRAR